MHHAERAHVRQPDGATDADVEAVLGFGTAPGFPHSRVTVSIYCQAASSSVHKPWLSLSSLFVQASLET